jgi:hypothetical protein
MANSDKQILITPNINSTTADPKIVFSGADSTTGAQNITLQVYPQNGGTLSFEGSLGQLFSVTNNMSGTIYSVNDISGIPSIEVLDSGLVKLAQYSGNVVLGSGTDNGADKLQVNGNIIATKVYNAVYNDIADYLELETDINTIEFGRVYVRTFDGIVRLSEKKMEKGIIGIASDTYGYGLGKKNIGTKEIPIAVAGFVLAYCDNEYVSGTALTCGENGILTEIEIKEKPYFPERIVATFYKNPKSEFWNGTKVNGRYIVKVK